MSEESKMNAWVKIVLAAGMMMSLMCHCTAEEKTVYVYPSDTSLIYVAPRIPERYTLFGEEVDLSNYYLRERFDRELVGFSFRHTQMFMILKRANKYFPLIEPILAKNGVPDDFKYLAVIESDLDPRVVSPAKAAGMWQILEQTGKEGGLVINSDVDERYNIEKATQFACNYLKSVYEITHSWAIAAASYNCGRAGAMRKMETQQCDDYFGILFGEETNRYVFRIMMAKYFMENPQAMGFMLRKEELYYLPEADMVKVDTTVENLTDFAKSYGLSYQIIKDANPWLRTNKITNREGHEYYIRVPRKEELTYSVDKIKVHNTKWVVNP